MNNETTSKLPMKTFLASMSLSKSFWTNDEESEMMKGLVVRGVSSGMKNLVSL